MADQLAIYNGALLHCGERFLGSLTEEREPRRLLDFVWASGGVKFCLERGQWIFAMRTMQIDYDPSVQPQYGYNRAFNKPEDWCRTAGLCSDEFFRTPLMQYVDEADYWYSSLDTFYVRYVSNDPGYGGNLGHWPESFQEYVQFHFALKIVGKLSNIKPEEITLMQKRELLALKAAKADSAMAEPTSFPAQGTWSRARNRFPNRNDGGRTTGNLIG